MTDASVLEHQLARRIHRNPPPFERGEIMHPMQAVVRGQDGA